MHKLRVVLLLLFGFISSISAQEKDLFVYNINLQEVSNDQVEVEAIAPALAESTVSFCIPKIIPGTYSIYDFGRFIEDFHAYDKNNVEMKVVRQDINTWVINNAQQLHRIRYRVNDSFDAFDMDTAIFEPAGSNIQVDTNYLVNPFAFIGYFAGKEVLTYQINVQHKPEFFGGSVLIDEDASATNDRFTIVNYHQVADAPIMYCVADTATVQVGNCTVLLTVYSPNKKVHASYLAHTMDTLLQAQGKYLGGKLPVDRYAFIIYLDDKNGISGGNGALEHPNCSVYYMPEFDDITFASIFPDVAAHEFFHILTPLTIHSEEIQYFDFNHPKMSVHLWLYEGTTEYHAHLAQVKYHLISQEEFLDRMSYKITNSQQAYNDTLPFTVMSKNVLGEYANQFANVYQKGALIGMCLDIKLLSLSDGKYGLQNLISDLGKMYGKDHPFKDDELFEVIGRVTYPEIRTFLTTYVSGNQSLPYEEILELAGIKYQSIKRDSVFTMGSVRMAKNSGTNRNVVYGSESLNAFGKAVGYRDGDEILSINGDDVTTDNFFLVRQRWLSTVKEDDPFIVVVLRTNENGKQKKVKLKAKVFRTEQVQLNLLAREENATAEQLKIRKAWLEPRN